MKYFKFVTILILFSLFNTSQSTAQERMKPERTQTIYLGYPVYIFDPPIFGYYVGYSLEMVKKERFSWELHASFSGSIFKRDEGFFAHDGGSIYAASLLFGPRIYLMKPEKSTRLYFNFMPGLAQIQDNEYRNSMNGEDALTTDTYIAFGFSVGSYLQFKNKFIVGAAYEQYGSLVFKLGYKML